MPDAPLMRMSAPAPECRDHELRGDGRDPSRPTLHLREQIPASGDRSRPVLYVHGATFPSALSIFFRFDGWSWADSLNAAGFSVWGLDFAGYGRSGSYPIVETGAVRVGEPPGRATAAAEQIERAVRRIIAETGRLRVPIIAHSWGTIATGMFATRHPELVERIVFFGPVARRNGPLRAQHDPWRHVTIADQWTRFTEDVPHGHAPILLERHFEVWAQAYLATDPTSATRQPASVRIPAGPAADIAAAWAGDLAYDPARILAPVAIIRGEWDSLTTDADAHWLLNSLSAAPVRRDIKIRAGTHLMHLEENRFALYHEAEAFLRGEVARSSESALANVGQERKACSP